MVTVTNDKTFIECSLANKALEAGFFYQFNSPQISGECPENEDPLPPQIPIGFPVIPVSPPIAPWCACTDDQFRQIHKLLSDHSLIINPGYKMINQNEAWAKSFGLKTKDLMKQKNWNNGNLPKFEMLKNQLFLVTE